MIISRLLGGLGNQMFQYAAACALATAKRDSLLLDLSGFEEYTLHNGYELRRVFMIDVEPASDAQIAQVIGWRANTLSKRILKRKLFSFLRGAHLAVEPHFNHWPGLSRMPDQTYMMGYWQSEIYFREFAPLIREQFRFRQPAQGQNVQIAESMSNGESVSVHVRRGDYISDKKTQKILSVCSLDYYRNAFNHIARVTQNPACYVFSDDIDWAKKNLTFLKNPVFIQHNRGVDSHLDMMLMSTCKHHIIANSTFSWWGAWLNPSPEKIVVAPANWFCDDTSDADLVPPQWLRL